MQFDQLRKIHSLTLDTNVLLDLPEVPKYLEYNGANPEERNRQKRVIDSYYIAVICLAENVVVEKIGLKQVEKELAISGALLPIFYEIFSNSEKPDGKAKRLAEQYMGEARLEKGDALIVATASAHTVDVLLTWNRKDLAKEATRQKIEEINKARGIHAPLICDPTYFIDRLILSQGRGRMSLALNPTPVPKAYRLGSFPSKQ